VKHVARNYLPPEIIERAKSGFGVPLDKWFRESTGMTKWLDVLTAELKNGDMIDKEQFAKTVEEHKQGRKDFSEILWTCINFWLWEKSLCKF
jgi:asparagine synthase (glutamine-hydrolysing)